MPRVADPRTRIVLLRAAEAVFSDRGLSAAKVEDITSRAGVSKGAFYLHFERKEDCFRQIVEGVLARLAVAAKCPPLETITGPLDVPRLLEDRLEESVELFEFCWQNRGIMKMILDGGGGAPFAYLIEEFAAGIERQSEAWIAHAVATGIYRNDVEPTIVARLIGGAYESLVRALIKQQRRPDIEGWARQAQDFLTRGLLAPDVSTIVDQEVKIRSFAGRRRAQQAEARTK